MPALGAYIFLSSAPLWTFLLYQIVTAYLQITIKYNELIDQKLR
jgi:hypothetical protein